MDFKTLFPKVNFGLDVQVVGAGNISIGQGSCIGDHAWLNVCDRDDQIRMRIGECALIGRGSMISSGGNLEIGAYCLFAPRVYVSDAGHIYDNVFVPYMEQGFTKGNVVVEENCWLGINVSIIGNVVVGRGSVVGANSVVTNDVPPFSVVVGSPARIVKLFDFERTVWVSVRDQEHLRELLAARDENPILSREMYLRILRKKAKTKELDTIVGGGGISI